jgi:hypothetical protein
MKIECILKREGGTTTDLGGIEYHFEPLADGAHVAEVTSEAHIDRFLAIPEGYKVYHGKEEPKGEPKILTLPVVSDKQDIRSGTKLTLNGSTVHEASYTFEAGLVMTLDEVVQKAFEASNLTAEDWNDLEDDDRHAKIDIMLDELSETTPADEDRDALVAAYTAKFGKAPHHNASVATIKAKLEG